jgi:hypothetical protein
MFKRWKRANKLVYKDFTINAEQFIYKDRALKNMVVNGMQKFEFDNYRDAAKKLEQDKDIPFACAVHITMLGDLMDYMYEEIPAINKKLDEMATKDQLKDMATKDDVKALKAQLDKLLAKR